MEFVVSDGDFSAVRNKCASSGTLSAFQIAFRRSFLRLSYDSSIFASQLHPSAKGIRVSRVLSMKIHNTCTIFHSNIYILIYLKLINKKSCMTRDFRSGFFSDDYTDLYSIGLRTFFA